MRTLIIKTIFNQWNNGLKFLGLKMMDRMRMDLNQCFIPHIHKYEYEEELSNIELMEILKTLNNEELLIALDNQSCDKYR